MKLLSLVLSILIPSSLLAFDYPYSDDAIRMTDSQLVGTLIPMGDNWNGNEDRWNDLMLDVDLQLPFIEEVGLWSEFFQDSLLLDDPEFFELMSLITELYPFVLDTPYSYSLYQDPNFQELEFPIYHPENGFNGADVYLPLPPQASLFEVAAAAAEKKKNPGPPNNDPDQLPNWVDPDRGIYPFCPRGDEDDVFDCDDWAKLQCLIDPENCNLFFIFSYGWAHALNLYRFCNPDDPNDCMDCLYEPQLGEIVHCWPSNPNDPLNLGDRWQEVRDAICQYYEDWDLDCDHLLVDTFLRFRIRDGDTWPQGLCGEEPWWECEDENILEGLCHRLDRLPGIDACAIVPECCPYDLPEPGEGPGVQPNGNKLDAYDDKLVFLEMLSGRVTDQELRTIQQILAPEVFATANETIIGDPYNSDHVIYEYAADGIYHEIYLP